MVEHVKVDPVGDIMFQSKQEFLRTVFPKTLTWRMRAAYKALASIAMTPYVAYKTYKETFEYLTSWDPDKKHGPKN